MSLRCGALLLVNYHYVRAADYSYPGIHPIAPDAFRLQVRELTKAYHPATPAEVEAFARGESAFDRPAVFFTFDDGLRDHLLVAEILGDFGIKGAFFVSSRPLLERRPLSVHKVHWLRATTPPNRYREEFLTKLNGSERVVLDDEMRRNAAATYVYDTPADADMKYLTNFLLTPDVVDRVTDHMLTQRGISDADFCEQLYLLRREDYSALVAEGHVVGCHGHSHLPFASFPDGELDGDVTRNIACLHELTGNRPRWVSYPYGSPAAVPRDPAAFCEKFEFDIGVTLHRDWNRAGQPAHALNRINTNEVERFVGS